jgi:paxillin
LDDLISNFQSGYGMVEHQPAAPAAPNNRAQKTSSYVPNNPNNNPHAVYNPTANNPHAVYNPNKNNPQAVYNPTASPNSAGRTNTNQLNKPPNRAQQTASRDLSALMDDLSGPDNFTPNPQPAMRKPVVEQPKLGKGVCAGCRKYINTTQKIQAMGREYHPEHFQCSTCNKVIGNGNFYEKEGQPQCDGCYQMVFCSKCAGCGQPITTHCVTALSQSWHPDCFVCMKCRTPFNNASYYEKNGKPYCSSCAYDFHAAKCRACNQAIRGNVINALGTWHPEHFVCQSCHQPFHGGAFYEVDGLPYCETHYQAIHR